MRKMKVMFSQFSNWFWRIELISQSKGYFKIWWNFERFMICFWFVKNSTCNIILKPLVWKKLFDLFDLKRNFHKWITSYFALDKVKKFDFVFVPAHSKLNIFLKIKKWIRFSKRVKRYFFIEGFKLFIMKICAKRRFLQPFLWNLM